MSGETMDELFAPDPTTPDPHASRPTPKRRIRACVETWPEAQDGAYDPKCCRFPKSCSATSYDEEQVTDEYLED